MSSNPNYNQNHCLFSDGVAHVSLVAFYERESNVYFRVEIGQKVVLHLKAELFQIDR